MIFDPLKPSKLEIGNGGDFESAVRRDGEGRAGLAGAQPATGRGDPAAHAAALGGAPSLRLQTLVGPPTLRPSSLRALYVSLFDCLSDSDRFSFFFWGD